MKISFVIPVFQNEGCLSKTYSEIKNLFDSEITNHEYEVIFVDDGSTDGSLAEMLQLRSKDDRIKVISFTRNFGQISAMLAGFLQAAGEAVINISADLQDPISLVADMIKQWEGGSEIVICHRIDRTDSPSAKLFSKLAYGILRFSIPEIPPGGFDFALMDRKVMNAFNSIDVRHRFFQGDLLWTGYKTSFIPYVRKRREIGKSKWTFAKKLTFFIDALLDSSYWPIRAISCLGLFTSLAGVIYALVIVWGWFKGWLPFTGWAPIMIAILLVGGFILLMLGVIGEYVWRIFEEVRKRPNFIIREKHV